MKIFADNCSDFSGDLSSKDSYLIRFSKCESIVGACCKEIVLVLILFTSMSILENSRSW